RRLRRHHKVPWAPSPHSSAVMVGCSADPEAERVVLDGERRSPCREGELVGVVPDRHCLERSGEVILPFPLDAPFVVLGRGEVCCVIPVWTSRDSSHLVASDGKLGGYGAAHHSESHNDHVRRWFL